NANSRNAVCQRVTVRQAINAVGQAAYYQDPVGSEVLQKVGADRFTVRSGATGTDNADNTLRVEVGISFIVQYKGSVRAVGQAFRVFLVAPMQYLDGMLFGKTQLALGFPQRVGS